MLATAPAANHPVVNAELRAHTTVAWRGSAGVRLRVSKSAQLSYSGIRLIVAGGDYAFARLMPERPTTGCELPGTVHCDVMFINWVRAFDEYGEPGHDAQLFLDDPAVLSPGVWDLYLFTNGRATLSIGAGGLSGSANYIAVGRISGGAGRMQARCLPAVPSCTTSTGYVGIAAGGGEVVDLRAGRGEVDVLAMDSQRPSPTAPSQPHSARACIYPNPWEPSAAADPAQHPLGCDLVTSDPVDNTPTKGPSDTVSGTAVNGQQISTVWLPDRVGELYLGFATASPGPAPADARGGYALWFNYGVR